MSDLKYGDVFTKNEGIFYYLNQDNSSISNIVNSIEKADIAFYLLYKNRYFDYDDSAGSKQEIAETINVLYLEKWTKISTSLITYNLGNNDKTEYTGNGKTTTNLSTYDSQTLLTDNQILVDNGYTINRNSTDSNYNKELNNFSNNKYLFELVCKDICKTLFYDIIN